MYFSILTTTAATSATIFDSSFLITVALIVISTLIIAFIKHLKKDKCIRSFKSDIVTVYFVNGENIKGRLDVENTGSEFIIEGQKGNEKRSYILYKAEYKNVRFFVRYHKDLDERRKKERLKVIKKAYHPNLFRKSARAIGIFFKIIRDSLMEIFTALSGKLKTASTSYATSEAYVNRVNKEAVTNIDTTYNPLLEKYIGNKVVCNHLFNNKTYDITGILKDYSGEYIELLSASFVSEDITISDADLVVPRTSNIIRNLGEDAIKLFKLPETFDLNIYKKGIKKSLSEKKQKK